MTDAEEHTRVLLGRSCNSPDKTTRRDIPDSFALPADALKGPSTLEWLNGPSEEESGMHRPALTGRLHRAECSPSATPMVHISELKFMEPAKVVFVPPANLAGSTIPTPTGLPMPCRTLQEMDRHPSNSSTASAASTVSVDSFPQVVMTSFKVKNTFIDDFADDSSEGTPVKSVKSCPARGRRSGSRSCLASISEQHDPFRIYAAEATEPLSVAGGASMASAQSGPSVPQARVPSPVPPAMEEQRQPEWSIGSATHDAGDCKPCMWFWRPQGCKNARNCQHCHLCPEGAVQERRKHRRQVTRANANNTSKCSLKLSALV